MYHTNKNVVPRSISTTRKITPTILTLDNMTLASVHLSTSAGSLLSMKGLVSKHTLLLKTVALQPLLVWFATSTGAASSLDDNISAATTRMIYMRHFVFLEQPIIASKVRNI